MRILDKDVPDYAVGGVSAGAVLLGVMLSFLLWCCWNRLREPKHKWDRERQKARINRDSRTGPSPAVPPSAVPPPVVIETEIVVESHFTTVPDRPPLSPVPPPHSPGRISTSAIVPVQPVSATSNRANPLTSVTSSNVSDVDARAGRLEKRYEEGKVAKMSISVYYCDKSNELIIGVIELRSIHMSVNFQSAHVELRRENCCTSGRLIPVRLIPKAGKLKGSVDKKYKFPMNVDEICKSKFNFYLWSTNNVSRTYQAGVCTFTFTEEDIEGLTDGNGYTRSSDFKISEKEDTTNSAEISIWLRYSNRTSKLMVVIQSITNVPKLGWRRNFASAISDSAILQPRPVVKIILSDEDGKVRDTQRTDPVKGYNPVFEDKKFVFDVPLQELPHVMLSLELSHSNFRVAHSKIGVIQFSGESTGSEGEHWREMIQLISSDGGVTKTHYIRNHSGKHGQTK